MNVLTNIKPTLLMGPGPSSVSPNVYKALNVPTLGHLDPRFIKVMDGIKQMLKKVFITQNEFCIAVSGTGSAAMESCFVNLIDPGDRVLVIQNGYFSTRMRDMCLRLSADLDTLSFEWGSPIDLKMVEKQLKENIYDSVAVVHAETSTGVKNPVDKISQLLNKNTLLIVDAVTSLGTIELQTDEWKIDAVYSCSQKGLSCPPGASPVSYSERAMQKIRNRERQISNWYLDIRELEKYWFGQKRVYHHTAPINMMYALHQGLSDMLEEGILEILERHQRVHHYLVDELKKIGLELLVKKEHRLPSLNAVVIPQGVDDISIRSSLLKNYNIEIGTGLGPLAGKVWRIGLMGYSAYEKNVDRLIAAFKNLL